MLTNQYMLCVSTFTCIVVCILLICVLGFAVLGELLN